MDQPIIISMHEKINKWIYACHYWLNPFHAKSGYVTDEEVKRRESKLRDALRRDTQFQLKESATVEVAQVRLAFKQDIACKKETILIHCLIFVIIAV